MSYACIVADPPWNERGGGKIKRGADRHYPLLTTPEIIKTILRCPFWLPAESSHLWLWVTNNHLLDGLHVMKALGYTYLTNMCWIKPSFGLGRYLRGQHELCLMGRRGRPMAPLETAKLVPSIVQAPKREHSQKPDEAFASIRRVSPGPRVELFARVPRSGWDVWGMHAETGEYFHVKEQQDG